MNFTQDWFTHIEYNFKRCMSLLGERKTFLEIGSHEGRSACWMLQNALSEEGELICIDPFLDSSDDRKNKFLHNISQSKKNNQTVSLIRMKSELALPDIKDLFNFIYIDGDHSEEAVYKDAILAWKLLKRKGIMLFDDYDYPHEPTGEGIDKFLQEYKGQYATVVDNYQYGIQKL